MVTQEEFDAAKHVCKTCMHFKPIIPDTFLPPEDLIGYCKKIHWPFFWCISKDDVITECYAYEKK